MIVLSFYTRFNLVIQYLFTVTWLLNLSLSLHTLSYLHLEKIKRRDVVVVQLRERVAGINRGRGVNGGRDNGKTMTPINKYHALTYLHKLMEASLYGP